MAKRLDDKRLLSKFDWSIRIGNCLNNDHLRTVADVRYRSDAELLRIPNFGRKSLAEVRELIPYEEKKSRPPTFDARLAAIELSIRELNRRPTYNFERTEWERSLSERIVDLGTKLTGISAKVAKLLEAKDDLPADPPAVNEQINQLARSVNKIAAYAAALDAHKEDLKRLTLERITSNTARIEELTVQLTKLNTEQLTLEVRLKRLERGNTNKGQDHEPVQELPT